VLGSETGGVYLWDLRKPGALWTIAHLPERVLGCSASKCGSRIVMGTQHGMVWFDSVSFSHNLTSAF
jgi:hypothetical protein